MYESCSVLLYYIVRCAKRKTTPFLINKDLKNYTSNDYVFSVVSLYIRDCHKKILLIMIKKFKS